MNLKSSSIMLELFIIPVLYFIGSIVVGIVAEKIILMSLMKAAKKTKWKGDDILIDSFKGLIMFWIFVAGFYFATRKLPFENDFFELLYKVIVSIYIISCSILSVRIIVGFIKLKTFENKGLITSSSIIVNITKVIVYLLGILVILQTLGISITPILTALGVGGLAVALALQDTLSNLFSGIQVIASQQVKTGDFIKLDSGDEGFIHDITWRNTIIKTISNNLIIVPNFKIASATITNYFLPDSESSVTVDVGVSYESNLKQVEEITIQVAKKTMMTIEGGVKEFEPFIRYHTFADSSINFTVIIRAKEYRYSFLIKHEFIKALHEEFKLNDIEIPFPIRTVVLKK